jgi:meso-butanediol dehydrogenase / (S,S)-butanediol dehydrogenase / diacetyl reductase
MRLDGKVALITGGGTGIGSAVAKRFVAEGAKVCIVGRRKEPIEKVVKALPEGSAVFFGGDVSNRDDVIRMVDTAVRFGGRLDILVNNAGIDQAPANVAEIDPDVWQKVIDVNLTGPMLLMRASIPHMIGVGGGSIINVASLAGIRCIPNMPSYCASKGGLIMLTQQAALDFGPHNIRCNVICPGAVRTEMIEGAMAHFTEKLKTDVDGILTMFQKDVPLRRVSAPREIAALCAYLASDDSSFITGTVIPADGGAAIVDVSGAAIGAIVG